VYSEISRKYGWEDALDSVHRVLDVFHSFIF